MRHLWAILIPVLLIAGCKALNKAARAVNPFSLQEEMTLGLRVKNEIDSDPSKYPVLPEQGNEEAYRYIRNLTQRILNTGEVKHRDDFAWEVKIIKDDETLNAFCAPGGYIYVYTGLVHYLDTEDELAGVMGHEIAHADLRHSTTQITKLYGVDVIRQIVTKSAQPGMLEQIATSLIGLKFSRFHESEADAASVRYLCKTKYNAAGAAGFFEKIEAQGGSRQPAFLSTHPNPKNRVEDIHKEAQERGCSTRSAAKTTYQRFQQLLR